MTTERIDPLAVIRRAETSAAWERNQRDNNGDESAGDAWESLRADLKQAHLAVSELVSADRDYDAAEAAIVAFNADQPNPWERSRDLFNTLRAARDRRAAALAAFGRQG